MRAVRQTGTLPERRLSAALTTVGVDYETDWPIPMTRRRADFAFRTKRVAVFVDGCFWHGCPEHGTSAKLNSEAWTAKIRSNIARDRDTDDRLTALGWTTLRLWAHESTQTAIARAVSALDLDIGTVELDDRPLGRR